MTIRYAASEHVAEITIDRPEVMNALDPASMEALRARFVEARDDDDVRVVILTGAGDKAFCSGADITKTGAPAASFAEAFWLPDHAAAERGAYVRALDLGPLRIWKPIVAVINGHCLGGGLELALQCHVRIAATNATFGLPEVRIGSVPAVGGFTRLLRSVPTAVAMKMALTGLPIDAREAHRVGLVSDVWASGELRERGRELARTMSELGPLAVRALIQLAATSWSLPIDAAVLAEQMVWGALRDTDDRAEGRRAFVEKRRPRFRGR